MLRLRLYGQKGEEEFEDVCLGLMIAGKTWEDEEEEEEAEREESFTR